MSLLGGGGRGSKQIKPMSLYILFFFNDGFPKLKGFFVCFACYHDEFERMKTLDKFPVYNQINVNYQIFIIK